MRLITRSDFDGLVCAVLLKYNGMIDDYLFAHPKDLQDGLIQATENDVLANVPYVPGCGMWFDHHSSENERLDQVRYTGSSRSAPSCARVIWDYYGGAEHFPAAYAPMLAAVDKVDSGQLDLEDILNPQGWVLLGFIMDPRTGLGRYHDYRVGNYDLMLEMIEYCARLEAEEILAQPDVLERVKRYHAQQTDFAAMLKRCSRILGNVLLIDLRNEPEIFTGNRFTAYSLFPEADVSVQILWGKARQNMVFTVGYSILKRTCHVDIGQLMLKYGGGGHKQVGTCQVPESDAERALAEIVEALRK